METDPPTSSCADSCSVLRSQKADTAKAWSYFLDLMMNTYIDDEDKKSGISILHLVLNSDPDIRRRLRKLI